MNVLKRIWNSLFYFRANNWFNLPKSQYAQPSPRNEGPFGEVGPKTVNWLNRITYGGRHGTPAFYVINGIILSIITLIEFWIFDIEALGDLVIPLLIILSLAKFVMVMGFYMHLRFDHKLFTWIFASCFALGVSVFTTVLIIQEVST